MIDLSIAESVFKITNLKNVVVLDLIVVLTITEATEDHGLVEAQEMTDHEKCSQQLVATVETNAKYHSNQKMIDLSIAESVFKITDKISRSF
jgi:hypothetical protein